MTAPNSERYDVVVVGGEPVALATALRLARNGVHVLLAETTTPARLPWTGVHHWSVLPGLADLGVLEPLLAHGAPCTEWGLRVLATGEQITYRVDELSGLVAHPYHLRVDEAALRRVLQQALGRAGVAVRRQARVELVGEDAAGLHLEVDDGLRRTRHHAGWVVAADGTSSPVRRQAGIGFPGTTWTERYVAALVEADFGTHGYADVTLQVDGTAGAVVERVDAARWRYVFADPLASPEEEIPERTSRVLAQVLGGVPRVLDWTAGRMHQRCAERFRAGRVLLIGDAAHVTQRLIGHSSIAAWMDGFTLGSQLAGVVHGRAPEAELTAWAEERRRVFLDDAHPMSLGRKNLVSQITELHRLDVELEQFRRAVADADVRREVLLQGAGIAGLDPVPTTVG